MISQESKNRVAFASRVYKALVFAQRKVASLEAVLEARLAIMSEGERKRYLGITHDPVVR